VSRAAATAGCESGHHVQKGPEVLRRLARRQRQTSTQILQQQSRGAPIRERPKGKSPPKTTGSEDTIAHILTAQYESLSTNKRAARFIIAVAGSLTPHQLTKAQALEIDDAIARAPFKHSTRYTMAAAVRFILRWLHETHDAPRLSHCIRRYNGVRPRNVTLTREEVDALLSDPRRGFRLWILLCSDLAIRSGSAMMLAPANYDPDTGQLRFVSKHRTCVNLPVTQEIRDLLSQCDMHNPTPFVRQMWAKDRDPRMKPLGPHFDVGDKIREHFQKVCKAHGITRHVVPHDLRRTTAVAMLEHTHDVRDVQALLGHRDLKATLWYLDHDLRPVKRSILEIIKRPAWRKEQTA
jgi:integrase